MSVLLEECPALVGSAGLKKASLVGTSDKSNTKQETVVTQANNRPPHIIAAQRDLLRDFAHEAATQAADHASMLAQYIAMDDKAGLKYSAAKFVACAREAARASRELIGGGAP
jgi:hypothetical protein